MTFTSAFTGAEVDEGVGRSLNSAKNLKSDYGAEGDGTTDDAGALRTALADFASGGMLFIPAGTYLLDSADGANKWIADLPAGVTIVGEGSGATILKVGGSVAADIAVLHVATDNVNTESLEIDGNKSRTATWSLVGEGIDVTSPAKDFRASNLLIHDTVAEGVDVDNASGVLLDSIVVKDCGGNGIQVSDDSAEDAIISNCRTSGNAVDRKAQEGKLRHGGYVLRGTNIILRDSISINDARCIHIESKGYISVSGFIGDTNVDEGSTVATDHRGKLIHVRGDASAVTMVNDCKFEDTGGSTTNAQVQLDGTELVIKGCHVISSTTASVFFFNKGGDVKASGLKIDAPSASHGFNLRDVAGTSNFSGCHFDSGTRSVRTRDGWQAEILGCFFKSDSVVETDNNVVMGSVLSGASDTGTGNEFRNNMINGLFVASGT